MYRHFQHLTLKFLSCAFLYREEEEDPSTQHPLENRWKQWRQTVCRTDVATSPDSKPATCIQNTNKKNLINSSPVLFFLYIFFYFTLGGKENQLGTQQSSSATLVFWCYQFENNKWRVDLHLSYFAR